MKEWYKKRPEYNNENLLNDLKVSEPEDYTNYMRMEKEAFDDLLKIVTPTDMSTMLLHGRQETR